MQEGCGLFNLIICARSIRSAIWIWCYGTNWCPRGPKRADVRAIPVQAVEADEGNCSQALATALMSRLRRFSSLINSHDLPTVNEKKLVEHISCLRYFLLAH